MNLKNCIAIYIVFLFISIPESPNATETNYSTGVFYFPGWASLKLPFKYGWKSIRPFPEREPLLSWYPEEEQWVTDTHLVWAYNFNMDFIAYDSYWDGKQTYLDHTIKNYLNSPLKGKIAFALLWANHSEVPRNKKEFINMITYWMGNYFNQPTYKKIDNKPVVFVFSHSRLEWNAKRFGETGKSMLERADKMALEKGYKGIFFVAITNEMPSTNLEKKLAKIGYSAYTGWNYVTSKDKIKIADYDSMVDTYLAYYDFASRTAKQLPYIVPASPGWDSRPWHGKAAYVREKSTPEKFERMLWGAKKLVDSQSNSIPKIIMIEAWNEFGEGSYIEPTKKWGFKYLETIKNVFGSK